MTAGATVIRDTLLTIPEILPLVLNPTSGKYKIFWEEAPDRADMPYIYISYGLGGWDRKSIRAGEASEVTWKVVGVTNKLATAELLAKAIGKLVDPKEYANGNLSLVVNDPLVTCNGRPREMGYIFDRYPVQGHTFFEVGAFVYLYLGHL